MAQVWWKHLREDWKSMYFYQFTLCHRISAYILISECFYSIIQSKEKLFSALSVQVWLKLEQHLVKNLSIMTDITIAIWFMVIRKNLFCSTTSILTEIRILISWWCDISDICFLTSGKQGLFIRTSLQYYRTSWILHLYWRYWNNHHDG